MNEPRLKDLRNTLRPLREARAILGDELMSDEDDGELMEAFISPGSYGPLRADSVETARG